MLEYLILFRNSLINQLKFKRTTPPLFFTKWQSKSDWNFTRCYVTKRVRTSSSTCWIFILPTIVLSDCYQSLFSGGIKGAFTNHNSRNFNIQVDRCMILIQKCVTNINLHSTLTRLFKTGQFDAFVVQDFIGRFHESANQIAVNSPASRKPFLDTRVLLEPNARLA